MTTVQVGDIQIGPGHPLVFIGGPCVIERESHLLLVGKHLKTITDDLGIPFILKTSFDKANRTSIHSYRGPGLQEGLAILKRVKKKLGVPILCDIHDPAQADRAAAVVDILQIPAFLCRQTDLVKAAAETGKPINVKKGQFLSPADMKNIIEKIELCGNHQVILTERGTMFGYNNLVVDMRSLVIMRGFGFPVMFDATHSVQLPGGQGQTTGGQREFVLPLARAAAAAGIDALFMEVHDDPDKALCDGPNMLAIEDLPGVLKSVLAITRAK
jgi:2-dehydro-3-deoxyphosphooctonate aldolase (KDO 8-P synthase)